MSDVVMVVRNVLQASPSMRRTHLVILPLRGLERNRVIIVDAGRAHVGRALWQIYGDIVYAVGPIDRHLSGHPGAEVECVRSRLACVHLQMFQG